MSACLKPPPRDLRISDRERNDAVDALSGHYVEGRLSLEEFDERSAAIMTATTFADLEGPFQGLPGGCPVEPAVDGQSVSRQDHAAALSRGCDHELEELSRKGKVMDKVDGVAWSIVLVVFLLGQFVLDWDHAWLAFVGGLAISLVGRAVVGFDDEDEGVWEQLKAKQSEERSQRLKIALERRRELER